VVDEYLSRLQRLDAQSERTRVLLDELVSMGTRRFVFTGSGEPFLHQNALEFMDRISHAGCSFAVNTNCTLLDRETIDELVRMGPGELRINTLAGSKETYLRTHPGVTHETFDKLKSNLLYLAKRKKALRVRYPEVTLFCHVVSQNHDGLVEFAEFASLVEADRVHYRPVYDIGDQGLATTVVPTEKEAAHVRQQILEAKSYLESRKIAHNINHFQITFRNQLDTIELYRIIPCYYGWLATRIDADGLVYPCCRCNEPLANSYEQDMHEIWYGERYREFREEALQINKRGRSVTSCVCNSCPHFTANLRVYSMFHPIRWRSGGMKSIFPDFMKMGAQ
jgi:MoaA/NifB/PqqE/SkfB family radical SAM enzyme